MHRTAPGARPCASSGPWCWRASGRFPPALPHCGRQIRITASPAVLAIRTQLGEPTTPPRWPPLAAHRSGMTRPSPSPTQFLSPHPPGCVLVRLPPALVATSTVEPATHRLAGAVEPRSPHSQWPPSVISVHESSAASWHARNRVAGPWRSAPPLALSPPEGRDTVESYPLQLNAFRTAIGTASQITWIAAPIPEWACAST
jgi:hypothetical protein